MAGQPAGVLEIEVLASVARLQEDMRKMQKAVGDATGSMSRSARAANDNLRGIGKGAGTGLQRFSRDVARLKAEMDPAWAATQRYKDEAALLRKALDQGAISHKQYVDGIRQAAMAAGLMEDKQAKVAVASRQAAEAAEEAARQQAAYANQANSLRSKLDPMFAAQQRFNVAMDQAEELYRAGAITTREYAQAQQLARQALQDHASTVAGAGRAMQTYNGVAVNATKSANLQRMGMQQLSYQMADVGASFAAGIPPMLIFAQQGSQVVQASALMTGGVSRLGAFLTGPWGMAIMGAVSILGILATSFLQASDNADTFGDALRDMETDADRATAALQRLRGQQQSTMAGDIALVEIEISKRRSELAALETDLQRRNQPGGVVTEGTIFSETRIKDRMQELRWEIVDLQGAVNSGEHALRTMAEAEREAAASAGGAADAVDRAGRSARGRAETITDAMRAQERQNRETERFIASLQDEIAKIGLDEKALRQLEVARQLEAAQTEAQRQAIRDLNAEREREIENEARRARLDAQQKETESYRASVVEPLRREAQALGLVGWERDKYLLQLEQEAELKPLLAKLTEAVAKEEYALADAIREQIGLLNEKYALQTQTGDWQDADRKAVEQARLYNDELRETINLLGQIGGVGDVLGGVLGVLTGNTSAVGGPIGQLLNVQTGTTTDENGKVIARTIGDEMMEIFNGLDSPFFKTFSSLLQGAGTGLLVGNAIFGQQDMAESIGSAIGGALGQAAGTAVAGPVGGAIGNILGSLAGGFLGDLIGGTPRGSAIIGNAGGVLDVTGYYGGSDSREQAASGMAGDALDVIDRIAEQLGATVNAAMGSVSIGVRDDHIHVDPQGRGYTKISKYPDIQEFGQDAEAAILFVIQDLINDGVLEGLRAGTERLIQQGGDLEKALEEALAFEGVFKELEQMRDPVGYALDQLENEFARLSGIFDKAGATVEEYADLEELFARKRQEIIDEERQRQVDDLSQRNSLEVELLQLLGREEEALAQAREFEIAGLEKTLQPLQRVIYQLQDARQIMDQFGPLADSLREFRNELAGSRSNRDGFAVAQDLFRSTARAASDGDATAMAKLQNTATDYLDAAKAEASSALDYKRAVAEVMGAVDESIFAADAQVEYAQMQIDAINANSAELVTTREKLAEVMQQTNDNTAAVRRMLERFDGDGLTIRTNEDTPIYVKTAEGDTVATV